MHKVSSDTWGGTGTAVLFTAQLCHDTPYVPDSGLGAGDAVASTAEPLSSWGYLLMGAVGMDVNM